MFLYFTTFTSHSFHMLFLTDQMKGFVSIFQLLGRNVRRISVVFHRNFTRRDNQHVRFSLDKQPVRLQILRNFVVHKPHTRKTCLTVKSLSDRETIDVKAVVNHYENSHEIIFPRNCHMIDSSSNEQSITVYRLTARKICKKSKINAHLHSRDREPS